MKIFLDSGVLIEYEKQAKTEYDSDFYHSCVAEGIQLITKVSDLG